MLRKLGLVLFWLIISPLVILTSGFFLHQRNQPTSIFDFKSSQASIEPNSQNHIDGQVLGTQITDMRPYYVANFLKNTKLEPYAQLIVETSDKYAIDYRLIPAIAMRESGGGNAIKEITHNAWGFENGRTVFDSWENAIETVAKTLKERYIAKGLTTPEEIMPVYAPPQIDKGGKWAQDINFLFSKLEQL